MPECNCAGILSTTSASLQGTGGRLLSKSCSNSKTEFESAHPGRLEALQLLHTSVPYLCRMRCVHGGAVSLSWPAFRTGNKITGLDLAERGPFQPKPCYRSTGMTVSRAVACMAWLSESPCEAISVRAKFFESSDCILHFPLPCHSMPCTTRPFLVEGRA